MKDRLSLIIGIIMGIVLIAAVGTIVMLKSADFKTKSTEISQKITDTEDEIDKIKASKDSNNFTPEELVKTFLTEVKADAKAEEKLYLASDAQEMDVKNTLKLGSDLSNMTIGDSEQTIDGDTATVAINLEVASQQVARTFSLDKENGAWKIKGIAAE